MGVDADAGRRASGNTAGAHETVARRHGVHCKDADRIASAQDRCDVVGLVHVVSKHGEVGLTTQQGGLEVAEAVGGHGSSSILSGRTLGSSYASGDSMVHGVIMVPNEGAPHSGRTVG